MKIIRDVRMAEKLGGVARTTVWRKARTEPDFPQPVKISGGISGWIESEVDAYLASKIAEARGSSEHQESRGAKAARKRAERGVQS